MTQSLRALVSLLALTALAPACASTETDDASSGEAAATSTGTKVVSGQTKSFAGTFAVDVGGEAVRLQFDVTNVNWDQRTATWNAKVLAGNATDDVAVPMKINVARCPGCYSFEAIQGGQQLALLTFSSSELTGLKYSGYDATEKKITKVSAADAPAAAGGGASSGGACSLVCGGQVTACKPAPSQGACTAQLFDSVPRCPHTFAFEAGGRCAE